MSIALNNFILAIANIFNAVLNLYFWIIIIASILSWVQPDPYNPIVRILHGLTEPLFYRIRKWIPFSYIGGLDLSPLFALLIITFIKDFFIQTVVQLAIR